VVQSVNRALVKVAKGSTKTANEMRARGSLDQHPPTTKHATYAPQEPDHLAGTETSPSTIKR
jgi:hypothetical protein